MSEPVDFVVCQCCICKILITQTTVRSPEITLLTFCRVLQQLRRDHTGVMAPDRRPFTSLNDVIDRLLPYHVFQGASPCEEDFTKGTWSKVLKGSLLRMH